jgi:uncharacterized protein (DUF488 family)
MGDNIKPVLHTIGHSNQSAEDFVRLLRSHGVEAVADVRSAPYARYCPWFNTDQIAAVLRSRQIEYVFLGRELGARPEDPACYREGRVDLARLPSRAEFRRGLERIVRGLSSRRTCLMCSEADPMLCHRAIVICRALRGRGPAIRHILSGGGTEEHEELERRLVKSLGLGPTLFEPDLTMEALIERAYDEQAARIAYAPVDEGAEAKETGAGLWAKGS